MFNASRNGRFVFLVLVFCACGSSEDDNAAADSIDTTGVGGAATTGGSSGVNTATTGGSSGVNTATTGGSSGVSTAGTGGFEDVDNKTYEVLEVNVTNMPEIRNGQPELAINPKDSDNIVLTATMFEENNIIPPGPCFVAYSMDRGETWTKVSWPMGDVPQCGESQVEVDAEGTFYIYSNQLGCPSDVQSQPYLGYCEMEVDRTVVSRSTDGGATWSDPVETPLHIGGTPKMRVDLATIGRVYTLGGLNQGLYPLGLSVSSDGGKTWSDPKEIPRPSTCMPSPIPVLPELCGFPGNQIAVYDGILATAVQEAVEGGKVTFHVSRDDGDTFETFPMTSTDGTQVPAAIGSVEQEDPGGGSDPYPLVSADPTRKGRFATALPRADTLEVYVTDDAGVTWFGPVVLDAPGIMEPWLEFGSTGVLGLMWRTRAVDAFAAVSFDSGKTFSETLRVNAETQPPDSSGSPGDDWSSISLDGSDAFITWPDGRSGGSIDAILARVPLECFKGADCGSQKGATGTTGSDKNTKVSEGVGKACSSDADCPTGGKCLNSIDLESGIASFAGGDAATHAPDGYCSLECMANDQCGEGAACIGDVNGASMQIVGTCQALCTTDADCREGYRCAGGSQEEMIAEASIDLTGIMGNFEFDPAACAPIPETSSLGANVAGAPCTTDADCSGGSCQTFKAGMLGIGDVTYPGGSCTGACVEDAHCGEGGVCLPSRAGQGAGSCLHKCASDAECREGYRCRDQSLGILGCVPGDPKVAANELGNPCTPGAAEIGGPGCASRCLTQVNGALELDGYCSTKCVNDDDCGGGVCLGGLNFLGFASADGYCYHACTTDADCTRDGYVCVEVVDPLAGFLGETSAAPTACQPDNPFSL